MPSKLKRPCNHIGCRALSDQRLCPEHRRKQNQARGSAKKRGYNARWRRYRILFIREHPLCRECQAEGKLTPTFAIDHIIPHRGDYDLFWDEDNHQPLCERHHNSKTRRGE